MGSSVSEAPRPRIGLTTYLEVAQWGTWDRPAALVPQVYLDAVTAAGGTPLLLPQAGSDGSAGGVGGGTDVGVVDVLDGLAIIGGADVDPAGYGEQPHAHTYSRPARDRHEVRLLEAARRADLPVLGICRGAQLVNVALGGTLHQHLPDRVGHESHQPAPGEFGAVVVRIEAGTRLAGILGPEVKVPCYHHQALDRIGEGLRVCATAPDGTVEALEADGPEWLVGVQWHPEEDAGDLRLFEAHVAAARERRGRA